MDADELDRQRERLETEIERLKAEVETAAMDTAGRSFDIDSPKQLSGVLFNKPEDEEPGLGLKPIKKTKTGFSTDAEVLTKLSEDASIDSVIPALILEYRQVAKLVSTYLVALKEEINEKTGRIHASFNQTVAATGESCALGCSMDSGAATLAVADTAECESACETACETACEEQVAESCCASMSKGEALLVAAEAAEGECCDKGDACCDSCEDACETEACPEAGACCEAEEVASSDG